MTSRAGSHAPDDVVARLREGAHTVPPGHVDARAVLAAAQRALRRRRRRQTAACLAAAGLLGLTVASPVHVQGVGTLTMPGGYQVRRALGVQDVDAPAPAPGIDLGELLRLFTSEQPPPQTLAAEVAGLQSHVLPVVAELRPTWYEKSECTIVEYPRGTFSDDGRCGGRPGEQPFDDTAWADLDRILDAVERSGVPTDELANATYAVDGTIDSVAFLRSGGGIEWSFAYIYSPDRKPPEWESPLGPVTVTPVGDTGWWFERSPND
jgi:hypothetical protein